MDDSLASDPIKTTRPHWWLDILETVAIALVICFVMYQFVAQPHQVRGDSMLPNYHDGQYILTNRIYSWWGDPKRGDVIVLKSPDDKNVQFIKRVIGLPGEKIKIDNNQIIIYNDQYPAGQKLNEPYLPSNTVTQGRTFLVEGEIVDIPANDYVVMGDNRNASYDSRTWGFVSKNDLIGRAFFIYWPLSDFGIASHANYGN